MNNVNMCYNINMKIYNMRNSYEVASRVQLAKTPFERFMGLMFRKKFPEQSALYILPCKAVHSFFMNFEFDVVFLNENNEVVFTVRSMKKNSISKTVKRANGVLELPKGTIAKADIRVGDHLQFK